MVKRSVREAELRSKRALVRVDFNVPLTEERKVADPRRIVEALPTLRFLKDRGARLVLMSHLGRPDGHPDPRLSLRPVAEELSERLGQPVLMADAAVGPGAEKRVKEAGNGDIVLLENLRFDPGEEANDPSFAQGLARMGDLFVEEAFGTVHRAHASTVGVAKLLPSYAGFLVEKEMGELSRLMTTPERPFVALLGGAKVKDKLPLLHRFREKADTLLVGGAMAFPFLQELGGQLGGQPPEAGLEKEVKRFLDAENSKGATVRLPLDFVVQDLRDGTIREAKAMEVPENHRALDIGPRTRAMFGNHLRSSRTVFFNGPMGKIEDPRFANGTREVLSSLRGVPGVHISAGGDSARALADLGVEDCFTYVSTGGGAAIEFIEGRELPGLAVLPDG
ncbi:MAG: phosphoglycerate kinase [Euryarchaeota archaeon]|nr:phosphoglycerate kinase [Euryarchaeota archaeon]